MKFKSKSADAATGNMFHETWLPKHQIALLS